MKCNWCAGDGWYTTHSSECWPEKARGCVGECPIQKQCEKCEGTGNVFTSTH